MTPPPTRVVVETHSPEETERLGRRLGTRLQGGDVVALIGPLGAGKTLLARGIALGSGATGYMSSPSFVLIREYRGPRRVYHVDLYRIERLADVRDLGLEDLMDGAGLVIIEWADRAETLLPVSHVRVTCAFGAADTDRVITLAAPPALAGRLAGVAEA